MRDTLLMAELWDGPASKAVTVFDKPHLGENRSAIVDMR
jgi:hypothetical protein